jgi:hypothetical protein
MKKKQSEGNKMRTARMTMILGLILAAALIGCSRDVDPTGFTTQPGTLIPGPADPGKGMSDIPINNFLVTFDGRALVDGNTVFTWTVRGTGVEPALSHFMVQLPECAPEPIAFNPSNSVSINTNQANGLYGVEWHLNVEADDSVGRQYSLTFPGDVPLGEVYSSVTSGNESGVGIIPGPCQGFAIAGRVFVDANENGLRDPDEESGIANVIIELVDAQGNVSTLATDQFGDYSFRKLEGTFTLNLPLEGYPGYFNSSLSQSFDPTTVLTLEASVPPDSFGNDFGFSPQSAEIIIDLETGVLISDGETLKFWKAEMRSAAGNGNGNHVYDAAALLEFLDVIQNLYLPYPYQFTPGNELQEAYDILRNNSNEPVDILLAELLTTELNAVSGRGIIGQQELQLVLIAWGEALIADSQAPAGAAAGGNGSGGDKRGNPTPTDLDDAIRIFELVNTGGGGGIDE